MSMKIYSLLISAGIVVVILGTIFHFQGNGVIGPDSSFMYTNPEWITYGLQIVSLGVLILCVGIFLKLKSS